MHNVIYGRPLRVILIGSVTARTSPFTCICARSVSAITCASDASFNAFQVVLVLALLC